MAQQLKINICMRNLWGYGLYYFCYHRKTKTLSNKKIKGSLHEYTRVEELPEKDNIVTWPTHGVNSIPLTTVLVKWYIYESVIPMHNVRITVISTLNFLEFFKSKSKNYTSTYHMYHPFLNFEQKSIPHPWSHHHHLYLPITIMAIGIAINSPMKIVHPTKIKRKTMKHRTNLFKTLFFHCCNLFTL